MRYFIYLSYSGLGYSGWQKQENAITVQSEIENALHILLHEDITVTGAGRTDSGVSARNYVAHFDSLNMNGIHDLNFFLYKLNAILPKDIVAHDVREMPPQAHARFDAVLREYKYYMHTVKDPFSDTYSYFFKCRVDMDRMNAAASYLIGEKDFASLQKLHGANTGSVCTVYDAAWEEASDRHYVFTVSANRFLRNMVRAMVGSLLEVGTGKRSPEWIAEMLEKKDRNAAGSSVPGNALFLNRIEYPFQLERKIL